MIKYKYFIDKHDGNGMVELKTSPIQANSDVRILNEELDNGYMSILLKNNNPLPIMYYIIYEINDGQHKLKREFCIANDDVIRYSKNKKYYIHNIELVELTKLLEKQYTGTLCFTPSIERGETRYYLSDCIERILRVFETVNDVVGTDVYNNTENDITNSLLNLRYQIVDSELYNLLKTIPAPQLVFNNPTLREALDGVLKYVNAVTRLKINRELIKTSQIYYNNTLNTKFNINIDNVNDKVVINIRGKKLNNNFCIFWDDGKEEESYQIKSIEPNNNYMFEKIYNKIGNYTISMNSDNSYEFIGNRDLLLPSCYIERENGLKETIVPLEINGLESIGEFAFYSKYKINKDITFNQGLKKIGDYAFYNIEFDYTTYLPSSLNEIGDYAFNGNNYKSSSFFLNSKYPPKIYENSFNTIHNISTYYSYQENYMNDSSFNIPITYNYYDTKIKINILRDVSGSYNLRPHIRIIPQETTDNFRVYWNSLYDEYETYSVEKGKEFFLRPSTNVYNTNGFFTILIPGNQKYYFEGHLNKNNEMVSAFWEYSKSIEDLEGESDYTDYIQLKEIDIQGQTIIGDSSFKRCYYLEKVIMSNEIEKINENAFYWCEKLNNVILSQQIKIIEQNVFYKCESLKNIFLHNGINYFKSNSFLFSGLEKIIIPYTTNTIETNAFFLNNVKEIFIPYDVYIINENGFYFDYNPRIYIGSDTLPFYWNEKWTNSKNIIFLKNKFNYLCIISADFFGNKNNKIDILNKTYKENNSQNIEQYATNTVSFVKNITSEEKYNNFNVIQYPKTYRYNNLSKDLKQENKINTIFWNDLNLNFSRLKSSDSSYNITDSNYGILTQQSIQSIINVQIPIKLIYDNTYIQFTQDDIESEETTRESYIILDITDSIIEEEEYTNLTNEEKNNYFYYKKNNNIINFGGSFKGIIFETHSIENVIVKALEKFANNYSLGKPIDIPLTDTATIVLTPEEDTNLISEFTITWGYDNENSKYYIKDSRILSINNITKTRYRISYVPILNILLSSEKQNTSDCYLQSENLVNQEERIISFSNFTNTTFSITQRNGNINKEIVCKHFKIIDLINVGDYTEDNYVCTKAEYIYYNNYIIGKYSFDKDYNRISSFMGINSEIRQYEVPNTKDSYERNIKLSSYCELSYDNLISTNTKTSSILSTYIQLTLGIMDLYNIGEIENKSIKFAFINYNYYYEENKLIKNFLDELGLEENGFLLECFTSGGTNVINFNFGFNDNLSGGSIIKEDEFLLGTTYKLLKQQIPYAYPYNENNKILSGCLRNLNFELSDGENILFASENLPLATKGINYFLGAIKSDDLLILKDPAEILKFTYQLHFISKENRITLGNAFFENNYIHRNVKEYSEKDDISNANKYNRKFYIYASKDKYDKFDTNTLKRNESLEYIYSYTNGSIKSKKLFLTEMVNNTDFYIQINKEFLKDKISDDIKTIILADEYDNIIMHIAYDVNDVDENGENYLYKPIYFNFKDRRSDIKYEY